MADRVTHIDPDQIKDDSLTPEELYKANSPTITNKYVTIDETDLTRFKFVEKPLPTIEESILGNVILLYFSGNGIVANQWLGVVYALIPSNEVFTTFPYKMRLLACTVSNASINADFKLNIWKLAVGDTNVANKALVTSITATDKRVFRKAGFDPEITINAGDKIGVYAQDVGDNPSDIVLKLYFQIIEVTSYDVTGENFTGDFSGGSV